MVDTSDMASLFIILVVTQIITTAPLSYKKDNLDVKDHQNIRRCGVDDDDTYKRSRHKRYVIQGNVWLKKRITWKIESYTEDLPKLIIHATMRKAFKKWSTWIPLIFTEQSKGNVDIAIQFVHRIHLPCRRSFDGKGGSIAHAFFPADNKEVSGDIHFDDAEKFTVNGGKGTTSLAWTALHEIGHSLGLKHSSVYGAVMSSHYESFYHPGQQLSLSTDDIRGAQNLYGKIQS